MPWLYKPNKKIIHKYKRPICPLGKEDPCACFMCLHTHHLVQYKCLHPDRKYRVKPHKIKKKGN